MIRRGWLAMLAFALVTAVLSYRAWTTLDIAGSPDTVHWVLKDFRDAIYYPVVALLDGNNPYDVTSYFRTYRVGQSFPLYSPLTLALHLPFGLLPYRAAELAYYVFTLVLTLVLARQVLVRTGLPPAVGPVFGLATLVLLARPGYRNLLDGQCTLPVVMGAYLALYHAGRRPWVAGLGLALTSTKPTFGVPLALLLASRGDGRVVLRGSALALVPTLGATLLLVRASGGVAAFVASLADAHRAFQAEDPAANALVSLVRIDGVALVARFLGGAEGLSEQLVVAALVLGIAGVALRALGRAERDQHLSATLACLAVLACTYHLTYDLLLLTLPVTALAAGRCHVAAGLRAALLAALLFPAVNYLTSGAAIHALALAGPTWTVAASANGITLAAGLLMAAGAALARATRAEPDRALQPVRFPS